MKKEFIPIKIVFSFIAFVSFFSCSDKKIAEDNCNKDLATNETEIYSKIANYWLENSKYLFDGKDIVIFNKTHSLKDDHPSISLDNRPKSVVMDKDSEEDFQMKNQESALLTNVLNLSSQYQYLSPEAKFYKDDLRKDFINTFPNAVVLIGFSRIGFNEDYSKAMIYSHSTFDRGSYIELERQNCEWKIKQEHVLWHH